MTHGTRIQMMIALNAVLFVLAMLAGVLVARENTASLASSLRLLLTEQEARMVEIATLTDRNAALPETAPIISDCPRRADYDGYLMRLASLSKPELITMQNLFESCSPFHVGQKALTVSIFERELESYEEYLTLIDELDNSAPYEERAESFRSLVAIEKERSGLMTTQTEIQGEIIRHLISGRGAESTEVRALIKEAQQIAESLSVADHRADDIRAQFSS